MFVDLGNWLNHMREFAPGTPLLALSLLASCSPLPFAAPTPPDPAKAIARALAIIHDATPQHPRVLKILFYGQSISTPKWTDQAMAELRARYPDVAFDYRNLALGGWSAKFLDRAAARDIAEAYPDLIVFHVYGDHRAYERIIRTMRSETAADVIVQTDHVLGPLEPICPAGFHLRWAPPPGCSGHIWFKQHDWSEFMSGVWIPTMAHKYDLALEPRQQEWQAYLQAHHLAPLALIHDVPHPNAQGWTVMANLFTAWFEKLEDRAAGAEPRDPGQVKSFAPPRTGVTTRYRFDGNRLELLATGPLEDKVQVKIDGKAPQDIDGCWQTERVSRLPNVPDWPALKQVTVNPGLHRRDRWTIRLGHFNAAQDRFDFTLTDTLHGAQGNGMAGSAFTSRDGEVKIDPQDWNIAYARQVAGKGLPEGASFTFSRRFVCGDQAPIALPHGGIEQRHVIATGLASGPHVVELALQPGATVIEEVRAYRPPLKDPDRREEEFAILPGT